MKVNQPASFAVSLNGAKGVIDAKVHSPSGALEECCVTEIDQGNKEWQHFLYQIIFHECVAEGHVVFVCDLSTNH